MEQSLFPKNNNRNIIVVTTDGGARGNPGPAACGYTINGKGYGEYLGERTNNEAEYQGVIRAFKKLIAMLGKGKAKETEVEVKMDSELLVRQFNNEYKIREEHLQKLFVEVHNAILDFKKVTFRHIPRKQNSAADKMVNQALDEMEK